MYSHAHTHTQERKRARADKRQTDRKVESKAETKEPVEGGGRTEGEHLYKDRDCYVLDLYVSVCVCVCAILAALPLVRWLVEWQPL